MDQKQFFDNLFEPFFHTAQAMDERMVGIMRRREEYKGQVKYIKDAGLEVLRSKSTGKHKIVYKRR